MKEIKKFKGFNKHLRYFLAIIKTLFALSGIAHICILVKGFELNIGGMFLPTYVSYLVIFISIMMVIMAYYYMKALKEK
ncbi:MAG: hypothetical protein LR005_01540 [Candidatus Pacebacteria bacterium]|nr:hypothetical protein [Candidatus Paceibacterota bacterium]